MRRLTLTRETLTALTADELSGVAGASVPTPTQQPTLYYQCNVPSNGCTQRVTEQTCTW